MFLLPRRTLSKWLVACPRHRGKVRAARWTVWALPLMGLLWGLGGWKVLGAVEGSEVRIDTRHQALLKEHCEKCHGAEKQKGKFRVDDLAFAIRDLRTAERWQKVLNAMNSGEMPPEEERAIPTGLKTDFLDELSHTMVQARRSLADQRGEITLRRLNRREYRNSLKALLGADINVGELPSDTAAPGPEVVFDTVGSSLFLSSSQIEQYLSLGRDALDEAFERFAALGSQYHLRVEAEENNARIQKMVEANDEVRERVQRWKDAVEEAAQLPENAEVVASVLKGKPMQEGMRRWVRRVWGKMTGTPSPEAFGFKRLSPDNTDEEFADQMEGRGDTYTEPFRDMYFRLPGLDRGAYLTFPVFALQRWNPIMSIQVPGNWPAGEYVIRFRVGLTAAGARQGSALEFGVHPRGDRGSIGSEILSVHEITGTMEVPQTIEVPVTLRKVTARGDRHFFVIERGLFYREDNGATGGSYGKRHDPKFKADKDRNGFGTEVNVWVDWLEVERRPTSREEAPAAIQALASIGLDNKAKMPTEEALREAFEGFATEAFRGVRPRASFVGQLVALYQAHRGDGLNHVAALKETLATVLSSPPFLYLVEPAEEGQRRPLQPLELACRLAFFLWGMPPDAALRELALRGELGRPEVLRAQTERLMADDRFQGFLRPFVHQWLALDRLDFFQLSSLRFPAFDEGTLLSSRNEVHQTFAHLFKTNSSVCDLLKANYVITNATLAKYYGLEGVQGDAFQKVAVPAGVPRGGLMGMAAILAMGGNGEHTSPVERGAWVLRKLMNDPPPPAPPNVPAIARLAGQVLTPRERLQAHQEEAQCASCHRKIDPIGFGLENFDPAGGWRTEDSYEIVAKNGKPDPKLKKVWTIEPAGALHRGPSFRDFFELRDIVASRGDAFARGWSAALVQYALGRPCGFSDEALLDSMVKHAASSQYAVREFVHALIQSKEFQSK